jgi:RNA polymerase sigma factor (sigma-70 family)
MSTINWQKIYHSHSPKLLGICRRYIQDMHTAEDIIQDSFITALQKNHQLKDEKALFAWLKKIVINNALQHLRQHKDTFIITEPSEIPDLHSAMDNHLSEDRNVFIYDFTSEELLSSIDSLPPHHKSVFNLYFIENHSHAEISDLLGITVNTSKSHLLRAKKSIQNYLLNNVVNNKTTKNKTAQLLVFIGLGSILWAQTFKSKFSGFSITPSRIFEIPENITFRNVNIKVHSAHGLKKGLITGVSTLAVLTVFLLVFRPKNSSFPHNTISIHNTEVIQENKKYDKENTNHALPHSRTDYIPDERLVKDKSNSFVKPEIPEEKTSTIKSKNHYTNIKDTLSENIHQKVIIVKKIIQRDTIYIER